VKGVWRYREEERKQQRRFHFGKESGVTIRFALVASRAFLQGTALALISLCDIPMADRQREVC